MTSSTSWKVPALVAGLCLLSKAALAHPAADGWITTQAKLLLFTADAANATMVHVDTISGRVLLYGKVTSSAQRAKATGIVRKIPGVTRVQNMLEVVRPVDMKVVDATDGRIREDLQQRLDEDSSLGNDHIIVESVNNGAVLLSGRARDLSDHLRAVECAYEVPGVRSVRSDIMSSKDLAAYNDMGPGALELKTAARDSWFVAASKILFLADSDVPALDVGVDASHGVVTLFGIVPSETAKSAAEADVRKVDANIVVENELQVVPASSRRLVDATDDLVRKSVQRALGSRPELKDISVQVKDGVVRLTGTVSSGWQRLKAGLITRATKGVRSVEDDLKV